MFVQTGFQQGLLRGYTAAWPGNPPSGIAGAADHFYAWGVGSSNPLMGGTVGLLIPNGKRLRTVGGSITVKQPAPAVEILVRLVCGMGDGINYTSLFTEEHLSATLEVPPQPLWLDNEDPNLQSEPGASWQRGAWVEWQAINASNADVGSGGAFEVQLTWVMTNL